MLNSFKFELDNEFYPRLLHKIKSSYESISMCRRNRNHTDQACIRLEGIVALVRHSSHQHAAADQVLNDCIYVYYN